MLNRPGKITNLSAKLGKNNSILPLQQGYRRELAEFLFKSSGLAKFTRERPFLAATRVNVSPGGRHQTSG